MCFAFCQAGVGFPGMLSLLLALLLLALGRWLWRRFGAPRSAINSRNQPGHILFNPEPARLCDNCGAEVARGKLVVQTVDGSRCSRWLCKDCFVSTWLETCTGVEKGLFVRRPQWLMPNGNGVLVDSTPPVSRRYVRVAA